MKRLIFLLAVISFVAFNTEAQLVTILDQPGAVTASAAGGTGTITLDKIMGEWDVSLQLIPSLAGSGDTLYFDYVLYQSNALTGDVWSILQTTKAVTSATDADALSNLTDFKGVRMKAICTVTTDDTVTVTPYVVNKKFKNE